MLWFDVESKYEATLTMRRAVTTQLWFDVESKYEATNREKITFKGRCGLMQNQNMKQPTVLPPCRRMVVV